MPALQQCCSFHASLNVRQYASYVAQQGRPVASSTKVWNYATAHEHVWAFCSSRPTASPCKASLLVPSLGPAVAGMLQSSSTCLIVQLCMLHAACCTLLTLVVVSIIHNKFTAYEPAWAASTANVAFKIKVSFFCFTVVRHM